MRISVYERQQGIAPLSIPQEQARPQVSDNGESAAKTLAGAFTRLQEINDGIEDARTLELFNQFKLDGQQYHEDPDKGIYHTRLGYMSQGIYKEADQWMREKGEGYVRQLRSKRAKANFRKMAREHIEQRGVQNSRFEAAQVRQYQQEQADSSIKNSLIFAEQNWNNPQAIAQARRDIQQALELRMRGSGTEAFSNAYAEIEDKIGVARIRQAFTQHPLTALEMLNNPDIHLKPETAAKLRESLQNSTEVYELQGIVQSYSRYYTPAQAVEAQRVLIDRFGADKGQKAFAALSRFWSVADSQKAARERDEREVMQSREDDYLRTFAVSSPSAKQIIDDMNSRKISPQFALSALGRIKQEAADAQRAEKARRQVEFWLAERRGEFLSDEQLDEMVDSGVISTQEASSHTESREAFQNKAFQHNKDVFMQKFLDGTLEDGEVEQAASKGWIKPNDAFIIREHLRVERERRASGEKLSRQEEQQRFKDRLNIIIHNGGIIPRAQVNELYNQGLIDDATANMLYAHEDRYNDEQRRLQEEQQTQSARQQAKQDEAAHKEELDKCSAQIFDMFPGQKGEALKYVNSLPLPVEDRDILHQRVSRRFEDEAQSVKDERAALKEAREKAYLQTWTDTMLNVRSQQQIDAMRSVFLNMRGEFEDGQYSELMTVLNNKERHLREAEKQRLKADNYDIARDYAERFGLAGEHDARQEIRESFPDPEQVNDILSQFNRIIQEKQNEQNSKDKAHAEEQEQNYAQLAQDYWRKGLTAPFDEIDRLEQSGGLTFNQAEDARAMNAALSRKQGVEKQLSGNIPDWMYKTPLERETLVMQAMGTSPDKRAANVAYLFQKAAAGTLTDAEANMYEAQGGILKSDAEMLREYGTKFDQTQKSKLMYAKNRLIQGIRNLTLGGKETSDITAGALLQFSLATSNIDLKAKNFDEVVETLYQEILGNVVDSYKEKKQLTQWQLWPPSLSAPTNAALRIAAAEEDTRSFTLPQPERDIVFMDMPDFTQPVMPTEDTASADTATPYALPQDRPAPEAPPAVSVPAPETPPMPQRERIPVYRDAEGVSFAPNAQSRQTAIAPARPLNLGLALTGGGTVTGRFSDRRSYRNGQHNGIDIALPEGSPITWSQDAGIPVTVAKVNTGSPSRGGGNSVTLRGTDSGGNLYEFIISHMKNGSIPLKVGDAVTPGMLIGRVGNTGMTSDRVKGGITAWYQGKSSGYHMDLKVKVNGKYVDPEHFQSPQVYPGPTIDAARLLPPVPETVSPPVLPTQEEQRARILEVLFGVGGLSGDILFSGDWGGGY